MKKDSYYIELEKEGYYETVDKRSKDYREYKKWLNKSSGYDSLKDNIENQPKGFGDTVAKITEVTGIKKLVKLIAGDDCGCDERKEILNRKFKYKNINCVSEEDYNYLNDFFALNTLKVTNTQQVRLNKIHNHIFGTRKSTSSCVSCVIKTVENLRKYLQVYN
jgi:hypothetical protein